MHSTGKLVGLVGAAAVVGLLIGGGAGLALGAASSNPTPETAPAVEQAPADTEKPPAEDAVPSNEPAKSERGNLIKHVGESAGIGDADPLDVEFTVKGITVDPECTGEYSQPPKNGHFIKLDIDVTTSAEAKGDFAFSFWKWIRPDGMTSNLNPGQGAAQYLCLSDAEKLPDSIGPSEMVSGSIVLDVPDAEGILISQPSYAGVTGSWYWEWAVPAE